MWILKKCGKKMDPILIYIKKIQTPYFIFEIQRFFSPNPTQSLSSSDCHHSKAKDSINMFNFFRLKSYFIFPKKTRTVTFSYICS
jgi:hypothetical protein